MTTPFVNHLDLLDREGNLSTRGETGILPKPVPKMGNMVYRVMQEPATEPITKDELKVFARIDGVAEDDLLDDIIKAVRENTELFLGQSLIQQTLIASMDFWPSIKVVLPRPPLISVTEVRTLSESETPTIYLETNYYTPIGLFGVGELVIKRGVAVPINDERDVGGFEIQFVAGYGSRASDIPQGIKEGIKLWATNVYENRVMDPTPPPEAEKIFKRYKKIRI